MTAPRYGSILWRSLPDGDPAKEAARDAHDAACWRLLLASPHVAEILAEWIAWDWRKAMRESSHEVSGLFVHNPRWVTFASLKQRRAHYDKPPLTAEEIKAQARASWAEFDTPKGAA